MNDWDGNERRQTPAEAIANLKSTLTGWRFWLPVVLIPLIVTLGVQAAVVPIIQSSNHTFVRETRSATRAAVAEGQRKACGPNNVRQALDTKIVGDNLPALKAVYAAPRQILWCEKTFTPTNAGETRYTLPQGLQDCFRELAISGYWVDHTPFTDPARLRRLCH